MPAHRDQREHVEMTGDDRTPAALEERRAGPQHHRSRQRKRQPVDPGHRQKMKSEDVRAHLEHEHRQGQHKTDPEPACHIDQFGVGLVVERNRFRLQRHAAFRATARPDLPHFGMHRTGIDRAGNDRLRFLFRRQILLRIGFEAGTATIAAEEIILPAIGKFAVRFFGIDPHAADGIDHPPVIRRLGGNRSIMVMMAAMVMPLMLRSLLVRAATGGRGVFRRLIHRIHRS